MPRSPTSSEDEMAQSFSDYSVGSESDSSREETIYDTIRATAAKPGSPRTEESPGPTLVIRIIIQDLQQTVSPCPAGPRACVMTGEHLGEPLPRPAPPPAPRPAPSCWCQAPLPPLLPHCVLLVPRPHCSVSTYCVPGRGPALRGNAMSALVRGAPAPAGPASALL